MIDVIIILLFWIMVLAPIMIALQNDGRDQAEDAISRAGRYVRTRGERAHEGADGAFHGHLEANDPDFIALRPALPG